MRRIAWTVFALTVGCGCKTPNRAELKASEAGVESSGEKQEFTGPDAETLIKQFKELGLNSETNESGQAETVKLEQILCINNDKGPISCSLTQGGKEIKTPPDDDSVYQLFKKNGVQEDTNTGNTRFTISSVECVAYQNYRGTSKCFYNLAAQGSKPVTDEVGGRSEFTGQDAADLIAKFKEYGVDSVTAATGETETVQIEKIYCKRNAKMPTVCTITQDGKDFTTTPDDTLIYRLFVKNGAREGGQYYMVTLVLADVECVNYTTHRGTAKCYFNNIVE